jgi:hypothetical protein
LFNINENLKGFNSFTIFNFLFDILVILFLKIKLFVSILMMIIIINTLSFRELASIAAYLPPFITIFDLGAALGYLAASSYGFINYFFGKFFSLFSSSFSISSNSLSFNLIFK